MSLKEWLELYTKRLRVFVDFRDNPDYFRFRLNSVVRTQLRELTMEGKWFDKISDINGLLALNKERTHLIFESGEICEIKFLNSTITGKEILSKPLYHPVTKKELGNMAYMD